MRRHPARPAVILGAGATGLTAALRLAQAGRRVVVLEQAAMPGGLAAGFAVGSSSLEHFYHHVFRTDRVFLALAREIGVNDTIAWSRPLTTTLRGRRQWPLDSPTSLLRFGALSRFARLRMAATLAGLRLLPSGGPMEAGRAAPVLRALMGRPAYESVWGPLLRGKFGDQADRVSMSWFWARIHDRTADLGYPIGGFARFYRSLADAVVAEGGEIRYQSPATTIRSGSDGHLVATAAGEIFASEVLSTLPTDLTFRLAADLPAEYVERFRSPRQLAAQCLILTLTRRLSPAYWTNVADPGHDYVVVVEHTNLRPRAEYGGSHLLYLGSYLASHDPRLKAPPGELIGRAESVLRAINPGFDRAWVTSARVFTAAAAQPVVTPGYRNSIPPLATPLPGLFLANIAGVWPHDRGQNYAIERADEVARLMLMSPRTLGASPASSARTRAA